MRGVFWSFRRGALVAVAIASVAGAGMLTWVFVAGRELWQLGTAHLAAILALAILPPATLAAWALDRRAAREHGDGELEDNGLFERPAGVEIVDEDQGPDDDGGDADAATTDLKVVPDQVVESSTESRSRQVHPPHRRRGERKAAGRRG